MLKIGIIYGGRSTEHDVSILTGLFAAKNITENYKIKLIYLSRDNGFFCGTNKVDDYIRHKKFRRFKDFRGVDCILNCCHGGIGETGQLSAFFEVLGIPITSCDLISAFKQQSKILTRKILAENDFLQPKVYFAGGAPCYDVIRENNEFKYPVIVKPDLGGSSIGVSIANNEDELKEAVELAKSLGEKYIVEEFIERDAEINIAVMKHNGKIITSAEEEVTKEKFYSFEEKYINNNFVPSENKQANVGVSQIKKTETKTSEESLKIKELAIRAYQLFESSGVVRSDFLVSNGRVYLNENNTVPGFLAYHLFLKKGFSFGLVIDDLIQNAMQNAPKSFQNVFKSDILAKNRELVLV
ncbi:MAG: ATP-grasp domain-containing protein [Christensenellaceae bacterium]|jgi:D-alanine-D-alanine ligase|nr:ATP-grasp domain-containing protein [Christensenellaceae bacterium]